MKTIGVQRHSRFPLLLSLIALSILLLAGCSPDEDLPLTRNYLEFELPPSPDQDDRGMRRNRERVDLGKLLYWDPILSGHKDVACATCHHPDFGYADGRDLPIGVGGTGLGPDRQSNPELDIPVVGRNAPTVLNTFFNGTTIAGTVPQEQAPMFWDNRMMSLENQALGPPHSFNEMRGHAYLEEATLDSIVARLEKIDDYRRRFRDAFGNGPITADNMAIAIAEFERTLITRNSPFDRFLAGDQAAMSPLAQQGLDKFISVGCATCHGGPMFSDYFPHTLGVPENTQLASADRGFNGEFAFRTPTLRNISLTAPYFHNGTARDLQAVMDFYVAAAEGRSFNANVSENELDPLLTDMTLTEDDSESIIAFMEALEDPRFDRDIPNRVPSGLPVGGAIQ